jgi:hypothetical protein
MTLELWNRYQYQKPVGRVILRLNLPGLIAGDTLFSPPTGAGGAPRQGWLNAYEGVFYRLSLGIFGWKHHTNNTDSYTGNLVTLY